MISLPKNRERLLVYAAGTCLALLLADRVVLSPVLATWDERAEAIREFRASLAQGATLLDQEARWLRWRDEAQARLLPAAPAEAESQLLTRVDGWARQASLRLTSLRPRWKDLGGGKTRLELQVTGTGSMNAVAGFVNSLETVPVAVAIEQLELRPARQDSTELTLDLRISGLCQSGATRSAKP